LTNLDDMKIRWTLGLVTVLAGWTTGIAFAESEGGIKEIPLGPRVLILQQGIWQENMTVLDAGPSLVVVDTWSSPQAAARAKVLIDQRFHKPVSHVINTHHHWDHTFGNQVFSDAVIVGHRLCMEDMKAEYATAETRAQVFDKAIAASAGPQREFIAAVKGQIAQGFRLTVPNHAVGDHEILRVGDLSIGLYHVPGLHTRSNLTIHVPDLGLLFTRREFQAGSLPVLETGVDLGKLTGSLDAVLASGQPVRAILVGHGQPVEDPDLKVPLTYLRTLADAVRTGRQEGRGLDQVKDDPRLRAIPEVVKDPRLHRANLDLVWEETSPR